MNFSSILSIGSSLEALVCFRTLKQSNQSIVRISVIFLFLLMAVHTPLIATTFYIDFVSGDDSRTSAEAQSQSTPWKHMRGMSGVTGNAASYSVQAGDIFILKGGSTWTFTSTTEPLLVVPASNIIIRGGQRLNIPWGSGYPVLDAGTTTKAGRSGIYAFKRSHLIIDGIKVCNTFYAADGSGFGIYIASGGDSIEVANCYVDRAGVNGFAYSPSGNARHLLFHDNILSNVIRTHITADDTNKVDDIQIYNNQFTGPGNQPTGPFHGDGIMMGANCTTKPSDCMTNVTIRNNKFYGDWHTGATAFIYLNDGSGPPSGHVRWGGTNCSIYNNQFGLDSQNGLISPAYVAVYNGWRNVKIYNNTFGANTTSSHTGVCIIGVDLDADANIDIQNNVITGCTNGVAATELDSTTGSLKVQNNLYSIAGYYRYVQDRKGDYRTVTALQAAGYENNANAAALVGVDPKFVRIPNGVIGYGDWHLLSNSPAIGKGALLNTLFTFDLDNMQRGSSWDIGAYQFVKGVTKPSNLRID